MRAFEQKCIRLLAKQYDLFEKIGSKNIKKQATQNPLDNSMWANMLDGALKALETVAIMSLDWKLTAIVKLLQSWLKDQREKQQKKTTQHEYGAGYYADEYENSYNQPYGGGTYY